MGINSTVIHHRIRIEFGLSLVEYCVIDAIKEDIKKNNTEWATVEAKEYMNSLGVSKATIYNALHSLQEKDLILKSSKNDKHYKPTLLFTKFFKVE